jgi:hypothetical protein
VHSINGFNSQCPALLSRLKSKGQCPTLLDVLSSHDTFKGFPLISYSAMVDLRIVSI